MGGDFLPASVTFLCCGLKRKEREAQPAQLALRAALAASRLGVGGGEPQEQLPLEPPARRRQCRLGRLQPAPAAAPVAWLRKDGNAHR